MNRNRAIMLKMLLDRLHTFFRTGKHCDITIHVEEDTFKCHRVVLATASGYFDAMFSGHFNESTKHTITLQNITSTTFKGFLEFAYSGYVRVTEDNIHDLLLLSEYYDVTGIGKLCIEFLMDEQNHNNLRQLSTEVVYDIYLFARLAQKDCLSHRLSKYMIENFEVFGKHNKFLELSLPDLKAILSQHWYFISNKEEILLDGILRWIGYSYNERRSAFKELIEMIDLKNLSTIYVEFILKNLTLESNPLSDVDVAGDFLPKMIEYSCTHRLPMMMMKEIPKLHIFISSRHSRSEHGKFSVLSLNKSTRSWNRHIRGKIEPVSCIRGVAVDEHLYVLDYNKSRQHTFRASASIDLSFERAENFQQLRSPPFADASFNICGARNRIYATSISNNKSSLIYNYDTRIGIWLLLPKLRTPMRCSSLTVVNSTLYAFGSSRERTNIDGAMLQTLDHRTSQWLDIPSRRKLFVLDQCCGHNGKIYASFTDVWGRSQIEVYDPVAGRWYATKLITENFSIFHIISYENCLWMYGPRDHDELHVKKFNPYIGEWDCSDLNRGLQSYHAYNSEFFVVF